MALTFLSKPRDSTASITLTEKRLSLNATSGSMWQQHEIYWCVLWLAWSCAWCSCPTKQSLVSRCRGEDRWSLSWTNIHHWRCSLSLNPLTPDWALRALIDFTLSNARRFYSSMGKPLDGKGLINYSSMHTPQFLHLFSRWNRVFPGSWSWWWWCQWLCKYFC